MTFEFTYKKPKVIYKGVLTTVWVRDKKDSYLVLLWDQNDLDRPNHFGRVAIILDGSNSFWSGPNHFGQVQIIKIIPEKSNLNLTKTI